MQLLSALMLAVEEGGEATNPILPETNEIIWGALSFVALFYLLSKFAFPAVKKTMDARTERIQSSLDTADRARAEAQEVLEKYQRQLADAKGEAARIIEEARQAADSVRRDLMSRAEAEATELRQRAEADIRAAAERAVADLRDRVTELAINAAEQVVVSSLDRDTQIRLIEDYINRVGTRR